MFEDITTLNILTNMVSFIVSVNIYFYKNFTFITDFGYSDIIE